MECDRGLQTGLLYVRGGGDHDGKKIEVSYVRLLLTLKLQGHCSVGDISQILKTLRVSDNSIGYVSQQLHSLATALPRGSIGSRYSIVILAAGTFSNRRPILVVLEARSHYILKRSWLRTGAGKPGEEPSRH